MMCSCGNTQPHIISRGFTADGIQIVLWSDGPVTATMGVYIRGVPVRRPKTQEDLDRCLSAGSLMIGDCELYDYSEMPALYRAAEKAAKVDGLPGTMRKAFKEAQEKLERFSIPLTWKVVRGDSQGKPTERFAALPRLRYGGMFIFDFCGGPGSRGGRFQLWRETVREGGQSTVVDTGLHFTTMRALFDCLRTWGVSHELEAE